MSGYYAGPFGRMLPTSNLPSSEQPPEPPQRPANRLESGDNSYQLPPPRPPGTLPFGTDPLLRQRQQAENTEPGRGPAPTESTSQPPRTEQQLPSVRHLLTPVAGPSSPPPPPFHQSYGTPMPSLENRQPSHTFRQHEPGLASQMPSLAVHDKAQGRSESFPQPQTSGLPPLSQMAMHSPGDIKHHTATRSDSSATPLQHTPLAYYGATYHDQAPSGGISSPESASRSKESSVRPHVIDERYVEGEGVCYVYADGSRVPKAIDGIPVNANWGVTKAGKPRKRLAQACLTCREKKIKCQPNLPKCDQCQKSGRECRFESAPRGSRSSLKGSQATGLPGKYDAREGFSPGALTASEVSPSLYNLPRASSNSATSLPGTSGQSPISEGPILTPSGTEVTYESTADADRVYRPRTYRVPRPFPGSDHVFSRSPEHFEPNRTPEYADILSELREMNTDDPLTGSWNIDPYDCDPETTTHYIESYFSSVNDGIYHIFPHSRFMLWLKSSPTKSAEDKMLLYSMMALGSIFSDRHDRFMALRQYSRIARFAIQKSQHTLSLQLAQSHLIMSLLYYATGFQVGAWDSIGAAGRAVSGLRYNVESGGVVVEQIQVCDYGLHPQALIECRRRTFWVAFILDRVSSFISASSTFIPSEAALIRLPCREEIYEAQQYATAPYFQSSLNQAPTEDRRSTLSPVAFLIQIISIWGDVSLQVFRLAHTPSDAYARLAEELHSIVTLRTDDWINRLPEQLAFSAPNLERASQVKKADAFVSNHMFYHATLMKLYRHVRYSSMRPEVLVQYIHRARYHAVETLRIALAVIQYANEVQPLRTSTDLPAPKMTCLNPFLGYVVLSAVDVLSAAGLIAELPDSIAFIKGALGMVQLLGRHWDSSLALANSIQYRVDLMIACLNDRARTQDKFGFAVDGLSLETKVHAGTSASQPPRTLEEDLFYGSMPREMLLHAMRVDDVPVSEHSIVWLRDR
ncbi:uncharacterized protein N7459_008168 [Penicillium hispanicum]|uniref:uncharacterized protein n=1 Tax=Penicillium hispanicum TaxID=1080232 RepID=UPI00253FAF2A|nr:uncharacterized protein N7459_008168 [Penicillium hispanicum]KAJ5573741.1 hypothetical protein N7459_008168 [Penicillium hispanicum]